MLRIRFFALIGAVLLPGCDSRTIEPVAAVYDTVPGTDSGTGSDTVDTDTLDTDPPATDSPSDPDTDTFVDDAVPGLRGFATINALDRDGTTGGDGDTDPVVATSGADMQAAIDEGGDAPLIIHVNGPIAHDAGRVVISNRSNVSIIGTSGDAELSGFGISITGGSNVIIRNLRIHHVQDDDQDGIRIADGSHHIWVDHCEIWNDGTGDSSSTPFDSLLDISNGADCITVSWCIFRDHVKAMYVGASDDATGDAGALRVTFHHNRFSGVRPVALSIRFGRAHLFNNLFENPPAGEDPEGTAISARMGACVRVEHNVFSGIASPTITDGSGSTLDTLGAVDLLGNDFGDYATLADTPTCTLVPPYPYLDVRNAAADVPAILAGAGPSELF